ncbi:MAG: polysaccharide biosynthesis protein [Clostridiales bacterium]|nr:polysaccharide biosynthesis protein [Clostridiales bacterium]
MRNMGKIRALLGKLNSLSPAAKASVWFVISNIALKGMSFITTPIFTRLMAVEDYGATSVFVSWESVISIFATLSLAGGVYNVAQTKYEDDINAYTSSMISLTFVASLLVYTACIIFNILVPSVFELSTPYLLFMWIQTFTNAVISFWLMRRRFLYDYKSVIAYTFTNALLSPTIAIIAILLFPSHAAYAKVIGAGLAGIVLGLVLCVLTYKKGKKIYNKEYWKYALKFNLPLIPHYLSSTLLNSSDKLMINSMVGTAQAGIYGIAHSITGLVSIITQAINYALIPFTLQSIKAKKFGSLKNVTTGCTALVAVVCIGVMLFAREGIMIFATKEYIDAVWFIPPLTMSVLFSFITGIIGNILFYYEKTWQMSAITITCAIINLVTNFFGIKYFGDIAAGYTTLGCSFIQLLLYYFVVRRYEKNLNKIVDLRWFFAIMIVYVGFMVYSMVFQNIFWARAGLLFAVLLAVVILHKKIIELIKSMLQKEKTEDNTSQETVSEEANV